MNQGHQSRFLAGKDALVVATSPAHSNATPIFDFSKYSQRPSLGCLVSRGRPANCLFTAVVNEAFVNVFPV